MEALVEGRQGVNHDELVENLSQSLGRGLSVSMPRGGTLGDHSSSHGHHGHQIIRGFATQDQWDEVEEREIPIPSRQGRPGDITPTPAYKKLSHLSTSAPSRINGTNNGGSLLSASMWMDDRPPSPTENLRQARLAVIARSNGMLNTTQTPSRPPTPPSKDGSPRGEGNR